MHGPVKNLVSLICTQMFSSNQEVRSFLYYRTKKDCAGALPHRAVKPLRLALFLRAPQIWKSNSQLFRPLLSIEGKVKNSKGES
jgi:hypothetical protein